MSEFNSIEEVFQEIKNKLDSDTDKKSIAILYAFNWTWKTRLSNEFNKLNYNEDWDEINKKVLCYNAFLEDLFSWDNENNILNFKNSWERKLIKDEWLDGKIKENFKYFLNTKIEPNINLDTWIITFNIPSWDDDIQSEIKISRWEESIFIWTIFYTILENAIDELIQIKANRSIEAYDNLEYIILDDPVSSIDDTKITTLAVKSIELIKTNPDKYLDPQIEKKKKELIDQEFANDYIQSRLKGFRKDLLKYYKKIELKFLVTTHHPLFYNIFCNSFKRNKRHSCILNKTDIGIEIKNQNDSPFGYHLLVKDEIWKAINSNNIQKYHFNLFRWLLEKTANFIWIKDYWECINWDNKVEFLKLINLYSHNRLEPMEYKEVSDENKNLFKEKFETFINKYNFN